VTEVKKILYSTIESIGKERIRADTTSNISFSEKYMDTIMAECIAKINDDLSVSNKDETIVILSEALLHFMLTVCTLPSERKIQVKANLNLDIVIPSLQSLKRKPEKSIIIEIIRDMVDLNKISQMEFLQPNYKNIWLVSAIPLSKTKYPIYGLFPTAG
jgi:hypothetical protein